MSILDTACSLLSKAYPNKSVYSLEDFCRKNITTAATATGSFSLPASLEGALVVQNIEGNFQSPPDLNNQLSTSLSLSLVFESAESAIIQRGFTNWHLPCISAQCSSCQFLHHIGKAEWDSLYMLIGTPAMKWLLLNTSVFCLVAGQVYVQVCGPVCRANLDCFSRPSFVRQSSGAPRAAVTATKSLAFKRKASDSSGNVFLGPPVKKIRIQNQSEDRKIALASQSKVNQPEGSGAPEASIPRRCSLEQVSLPSGSVCHLLSISKIRLINPVQEVNLPKPLPVGTHPSEVSGNVKEALESSCRKKRRKKKPASLRHLPDHRRAFNGSLVITHDDVLYSHSGWTHFQLQHPLQRNSSADLLKSIIETDVGSDVATFDASQLEPLKVLIERFHEQHRAFRYERLLTITTGTNGARERKPVPSGQVFLFLRRTTSLVPEPLLGNSVNVKIFVSNVKRFVFAGRGRSFSLGDLMQNMQTSRCKWLRGFRSLAVQACLMAKVIVWLFNDFIKPLLRQHFYITETTYGRNGLIFFTKSDWQSIRARALRHMCPNQNESEEAPILKPIDATGSFQPVINAKLRFVPKRQGLRPIMNATFSSRVNKKLINNALLLLRTIYQQFAEYVDGKSAADFRQRWLRFVQQRSPGPVYYVRVDVADAYGSILHAKLEAILTKYLSTLPRTTQAKTVCFVDPSGKRSRNFRLLPALKDMHNFFESLPQGSIVFNQNINETLDIGQIINFVISCIRSVAVTHNNDLFQICQGVPQGGRLSASLCHLYYGSMVREHLGPFQSDPNDLLLRVVDDFLYITPSYQRAVLFFQEMHAGFPDFNCYVNQIKTVTNLPQTTSSTAKEPIGSPRGSPTRSKQRWASFCGLQFNSETLHIRGDYTNYERMDVIDCMTAPNGNKPGLLLWNRVCMISTLKLQVLYVDGAINSNCRVVRNVYHASLMAAYRLHALITHLLWTRRKKQTVLNINFLCRVVENCAKKTCAALGNIRKRWEAKVPLKNAEAKWLSFQAFRRKLGKHRERYANILRQIADLQRKVGLHLRPERLAKLRKWIGRRLPLSFRRMKKPN